MADIKLNTRFGELCFDTSQIITFPHGIPGFEKNTRWAMFHEVDEQGHWVKGVVVHLQSIDDGNVSLPLADPGVFGFAQEVQLSGREKTLLELKDDDDLVMLVTLYPEPADANGESRIVPNLTAPIFINTRSKLGMQKVLGAAS